MNSTGVAEINPHPSSGIEALGFLHADIAGCGFVLRLPGQHVVIASLPVVKKCADRSEELQRRLQFLVTWPLLQRLLRRPLTLTIKPREQRHPRSNVVVADPAGRLFQVGLKMERGVSILSVSRTSDFGELLDDVISFPQKEFWQHFFVQPLEQFSIAGNVPAIE